MRSSSGNPGVCGSDPEISTRPSGRRVASEWYSRAMVVLPRIEKREPVGCVGSYNRAFRFGSLASPKPATP